MDDQTETLVRPDQTWYLRYNVTDPKDLLQFVLINSWRGDFISWEISLEKIFAEKKISADTDYSNCNH